MKLARLLPLFVASVLYATNSTAAEHDQAHWEQVVAEIRVGMKRSEVEKLLPIHSWFQESTGFDYASASYMLERHRWWLQVVYHCPMSNGKPLQPKTENRVSRVPTLYDPRPEWARSRQANQ